jgi:hypothetical protein
MTPWIARSWLAAAAGCPVYELELVDERVADQEIRATYRRGALPFATLTGSLVDRGPGRERVWVLDARLEDGRLFSTDVRGGRRILL